MTYIHPLLDHKLDFVEFVHGLLRGDLTMWVALAVIVAIVAFMAVSQARGVPFVKPRKQRREALKKRKRVVYEYDRHQGQ